MQRTKLTTVEKRAKNYCDHIKEYGSAMIEVNWKKSSMYGLNPVIDDYSGDKCTNVSGCGYCKLSTALADCLRFLFDQGHPAHMEVWQTGGCGDSSVMEALERNGWRLEKTYANNTVDVYKLYQIES